MALKTLTAEKASKLDEELMSESGGFSIDQLMELAGLSVSQAVYKFHPLDEGNRVLIACGPGNNGGDGLVAARHLHHLGYKPTIYYPKQGKSELYGRLVTQLQNLSIPFTQDFTPTPSSTDLILDSLFGFSFQPPVRPTFAPAITTLEQTAIPVLSIDCPSSWNIETGPPDEGPGNKFMPEALISLTAPKTLVKWFRGGRHWVGGRFLDESTAKKFGLDVPGYEGLDHVVEVTGSAEGEGKL